ncbi:MAG: helix-turn-helix transcriptional regulator [Flavobacteriales bacterium]|nr:helix-turn-helix transcriptional regulator [Flavobacteriales bacterium]
MQQLPIPRSLEPFVKDIYLLESDKENTDHKFPFYADGFPGIIYSRSSNPFYLQPKNIELSDFYLYGQTIEPISLRTEGAFHLVGMRLYPFTVRILLGIDPKVLNDDCFDLILVDGVDTQLTLDKLRQTDDSSNIVDILTNYFHELLENESISADWRIQLAINLILNSNGMISIKEIRNKLFVGERTLERHFLKEIGVTTKQFAKIIQFSSSLKQMTETDYYNLTEIGYDNGFADQSHFIREFKRYAGKTPSEFQKQISL